MSSLNRFNWIAPYYDTLTCLVFGNTIWKAQTGYLNYVPPHATVLVLGGGSGKWLRDLLQRNETCQICFVEASSKMVELAKKNNPQVSYQPYDGVTLPYEDNSFSIAFTICVMHHVPPKQWASFIGEMSRVVKPGGMVVVFEHNPINPVTSYIVKHHPFDKNAVMLKNREVQTLMKNPKTPSFI